MTNWIQWIFLLTVKLFLSQGIAGLIWMIPGYLAFMSEIFKISLQERRVLTCCFTEGKVFSLPAMTQVSHHYNCCKFVLLEVWVHQERELALQVIFFFQRMQSAVWIACSPKLTSLLDVAREISGTKAQVELAIFEKIIVYNISMDLWIGYLIL